jgi:hypothetical protein
MVGRNNPEEEHTAPHRPTSVSFPDATFLQLTTPTKWTKRNAPNLFDLRLRWQYVQQLTVDLGPELWKILNVKYEGLSAPQELLGDNAKMFLPPPEWLEEPGSTRERRETQCRETSHWKREDLGKACGCTLHHGRPWPTRLDYYERARDLMYENKAAFHGYTRATVDGKPPPRLTHGRPFVQQLDSLVQYWDTSLDEYISPAEDETKNGDDKMQMGATDDESEPRKRTKLTSPPPELPSSATHSTEPQAPRHVPTFRRPGIRAPSPPLPPPGTYKGWRTECGSKMPNHIRDLTVKALLDMTLWPYGMHVDNHDRTPPKIEVQSLRVSVPLTRRVWRDPMSRLDARAGVVQGPCLGMSARPMTGFVDEEYSGQLDLIREFGALLLLAQERNREERTEEIPGKGKFWSEKPRWSGQPYEVPGEYKFENGEDMPDQTASPDEADSAQKPILGYTARKQKKKPLPSDMTMKQRSIYAYKRCGPTMPNWDSKAKYSPIGKEPGSAYDEVGYESNFCIQLI